MTPPGGFLNAHCHLELSHLRGRLRIGSPFVEWLERIVALKRATTTEESTAAARESLASARATGTAAILDILSLDTTAELLAGSGMPSVRFREAIAFREEDAEAAVRRAVERQGEPASTTSALASCIDGLSPHAPYTTTAALLRAAAAATETAGQWLCIHASETPEEELMMREGRGALREYLGDVGALPGNWRAPGMSSIEWLANNGVVGPRTLLVHCNELSERDAETVLRLGASVVVCPGCHAWFGRGKFPLAMLLQYAIPCFIGTDSLASNDSLDMSREARIAAELCPSVEPSRIAALADAARFGHFVPPTAAPRRRR